VKGWAAAVTGCRMLGVTVVTALRLRRRREPPSPVLFVALLLLLLMLLLMACMLDVGLGVATPSRSIFLRRL
jgi:hypothetical protein